MTALCLCFCTLHTNEIPRIDPLVQVDYVRVVDLDIGASKSDNQLLLGLNDNGCVTRDRLVPNARRNATISKDAPTQPRFATDP